MKKSLFLLSLGLLTACANDDELLREQQERMVAEQPIENPFFSEGAMVATEVSDRELRQFVLLNMDFGRIQAAAQQKMIEILRDEELSTESYNSILQTLSMVISIENNPFSESDIEKFDRAKERISELRVEVDEKIEFEIAQSEFSMDRFMDLNVAANHHLEIMERAREMAINITQEEKKQD